jgi:sensor domain CHASE-containing protein
VFGGLPLVDDGEERTRFVSLLVSVMSLVNLVKSPNKNSPDYIAVLVELPGLDLILFSWPACVCG